MTKHPNQPSAGQWAEQQRDGMKKQGIGTEPAQQTQGSSNRSAGEESTDQAAQHGGGGSSGKQMGQQSLSQDQKPDGRNQNPAVKADNAGPKV